MLQWRAGLRIRLMFLVLIPLVPILGLVAYTAIKNQQAAMELARANLKSETVLAAANQQRVVERISQLLGDMASGPSVKDTSIRLCVPYLKNLKSQDASYANLGVIGLDGVVTCHALDSGKPERVFLGDRAFFKQVLATQKFAVGQFGVGPVTGLPSIGLGMPVFSNDGVLNGVAFAALDLAAMSDRLGAAQLMAGAEMRVIDRQNTVLAVHPGSQGRPRTPGSQEPDAQALVAAKAQQPGLLDVPDGSGIQRIHAYAPVAGTNGALFVMVSVPRDAVTAGPSAALAAGIAALILVTSFGLMLAWWAAGRVIVKPARAILKEADEITRGNLAARVSIGPAYQGELGAIGEAFNRMAQALQARGKEVDEAVARVNKERSIRDLILNNMSEGVLAVDTQGRVLLFNKAVSELFSPPGQDMLLDDWRDDHQLLTLDGSRVYPLSERPLTQAIRGVSIDNWDVLSRKPGVDDRVLRISARPILDEQGQLLGAVSVFNNITDLKLAERFDQDQQQVLTLIAKGAPLHESCEAIVRLAHSGSPDGMCCMSLVQGNKLHIGASVGLPESFLQAIEGMPVADGAGACGTAAFLKRLVVVGDVATDPLMNDFREVGRTYGLGACWSSPVMSAAGEVLATFAIYHHQPRTPQSKDLELLETATRLARIALERYLVEKALRSSEARFREMAENMQDIFYNWDARTRRVLYVSPGYEKLLGRSCESLYADPDSFFKCVLPEDHSTLRQGRRKASAGNICDMEYRIMSPEGQIRWVRDIGYPVRNADHEVERVVGIARDITERKLSDLALASVNRAMQMLSRSSVAINALDNEASLLAEVCRVAVEVGGYRMAWVGFAQDDEARTIAPVAHAGYEAGYLSEINLSWRDDRPQGQGPAGRAIRTGLHQQSSDITIADGNFFWKGEALRRGYRSGIFLPLRNGATSFGLLALYSAEVQNFATDEVNLLQELADNVAFGIGSFRARETARAAVAKISEQASLLDRAQDAIMVRNPDLTLRYWSKGAERMYGWTSDEVLGKTMTDVMYRDPQVLADALQQTLAGEGDWAGELDQIAKDGSPITVEARWTVVRDENGVVNGALGINTDIRERRHAREQILALNASLEERVLQRTAQLEFANNQLEAFSYSVSHDLRTPLSALDGFSTLLEKTLGKTLQGPDSERSRHYLSRIRSGVRTMGDLIDAMLSLAQVSRSALRWEPADLSAMASSLLAGYQEREPDRRVALQVQQGLIASGDPRLLNQVLDNLLRNAWKFSSGHSCTDITFGRTAGENNTVVYFVRDKGAGFDMEYYEKLFGPFQRLHSPSEFAGTGIGLTTVQRIIQRHGGEVWAEAAPGMGATFYFTLGAAKL